MTKRKYNTRSSGSSKKEVIENKSSVQSKFSIEEKKITREIVEELRKSTVFADPTYDVTFNMLFGSDNNKNILISLLNNLLNFTGDNEIKEVEINKSELQHQIALGVKGAVDVLCTTKGNKKIAVEMQRQYKEYFLPRSQEYMSKIVANQVKIKESGDYHNAVKETYVLCIGKNNIFIGDYYLQNLEKDKDPFFEKTVVPYILEAEQIIPGNKMFWKFYELPRFAREYRKKKIGADSELKLQWLNFLRVCNKQTKTPGDVNEVIKEAYRIMEVAMWNDDKSVLYWKQKRDEQLEKLEQERIQKEQYDSGVTKGIKIGKEEGLKIGKEEGLKIGEERGAAKGELNKTLEIAKKMLSQDFDKKVISSVTGLSLEKIQVLSEPIEKEIMSEEMIISHEDLNPEHEASVELAGDV